MNSALKIALAAAAVLVVAVVGFNLMPQSNQVAAPSQTPAPTPSATSSPSPSPEALGPLEAGTYTIDDPSLTAVPYSFTVPAGWTGRADGSITKNAGEPDELGFFPWVVTHVYTDACRSEGALTEIGPTVDDLVRALVDQVSSDASTPVDVTLGGQPAKRIDVSIPATLDLATCRHPGELIQVWADPAESTFFAIAAQPGNQVNQVYIADVNGARSVIVSGHPQAASASDIAEMQTIVDSIAFQP